MNEDKIISCLAHNGKVNIRCIKSTNMVEEARKLHDLSPTATAALGRLLTITSLLGKEMKGEEGTITTQIKGNGPIGTLVAVSDNKGNVKHNRYLDLKFTVDDRICDGQYYASALHALINYIKHPELLEQPPKEVVEDIK